MRKKTPSTNRPWLRLVVACVWLMPAVYVPAASAQEVPGGFDAGGVFVDDSTQAVDAFTLAGRLADLGEWRKASEVYLEAAAEFEGRLVLAAGTADGVQYRPVADAVRERIVAWPAEGLAAYRDRFGGEARRALESARRLAGDDAAREAALTSVARRFPATGAAAAALLELVDARLAAGDVAAARRLARAALADGLAGVRVEGVADDAEAAALLRLVIASALSGLDDEAADAAGRLATTYREARGVVAGVTVRLSDAAADVLGTAPQVATPPAGAAWATLGGSADRNRIAAAAPGVLSPQFAAPAMHDADVVDASRNDLALHRSAARRVGQLAGVFPVAADGVLYWTDNAAVHAIDMTSGTPPAAWSRRHAETEGRLVVEPGALTAPRGVALAPVVDGPNVLMTVGRQDMFMEEAAGRQRLTEPAVVAVDRAEGTVSWRTVLSTAARTLPSDVALTPEATEALAEATFAGPPVVAGRVAWVLAATDPARSRPFEQAFAVGLDADTGAVAHVVPLATSGSGAMRRRGMSLLNPAPDALPAASGGVVYLPTARGALAAIEAATGRLLWLNLYTRDPDGGEVDARLGERMGNVPRGRIAGVPDASASRRFTPSLPFHASAPVVADGRVFFRPPDAEAVLVYDAADGTLISRMAASPEAVLQEARLTPAAQYGPDTIRAILAVDGDRLYALGGRNVYCIRWRDAVRATQAGRFDALLPEEWAFWISTFEPAPEMRGAAVETVVGRPAVTRTHVVVPTSDRLVLVANDTGVRDEQRLGETALYTALPDPQSPAGDVARGMAGNVTVLDDRVVVSGQTSVGVWFDRDAIRRQLLAEAGLRPEDPQPVIELARLDFIADDIAAAEQALRRAADMAGGRDGAFDAALELALTRRGAGVGRMLDLAEDLADTPRRHVRARLARADAQDVPGGVAEQLAALRDILTVPEWRTADAGGDEAGFAAGDVASGRIDALRTRSGPGLHEQVDREASAARAEAGDDSSALRDVADVFPNSPAARDALFALADAADDGVAAAGLLREAAGVSRRLRDDAGYVEATLRLARLDLLDASPAALADAAARLRYVASRSPMRVIELPASEGVPEAATAEQAAFAVSRLAVAADASATPTLWLPHAPAAAPFVEASQRLAADVDRLVPVMRGARDAAWALAAAGTELVAAGVEETWRVDLGFAVRGAAWHEGDVLAWGAGGVARVTVGGNVVWRIDASDLPALVGSREIVSAASAGNDVFIHGTGRLAAVKPDGTTRWAVASETPADEVVVVAASRDAVVVRAGDMVFLRDAATARLKARRSVDASLALNGGLVDVVPLAGGRVAAVAPAAVLLFDPVDPTQRLAGAQHVVRPDRSAAATTFAAAAPVADDDAAWAGGPRHRRVAEVAGRLIVTADLRGVGRADGLVIDPLDGSLLATDNPVRDGDRQFVLLTGDAAEAPDPGELAPRLREQVERAGLPGVDVAGGMAGVLFVDGTRIYVAGRRGLHAFDLDTPDGSVGPHWWRDDDAFARALDPAELRGVIVGRDFVVLHDRTPDGDRLVPFGRHLVDGKGYESGLVRPALAHAAVSDARPVEGGVVTLDADGVLRLHRGARNP